MKLLGVDYGSKRVGLALADTVEGMCLPWRVLEGLGDEALAEKLAQIVAEEKIDALVFGEPLQLSGERGSAALRVHAFVKDLQKHMGAVPIHLIDERFSSAYADHFTKESGVARDAVAAAGILDIFIQRMGKE